MKIRITELFLWLVKRLGGYCVWEIPHYSSAWLLTMILGKELIVEQQYHSYPRKPMMMSLSKNGAIKAIGRANRMFLSRDCYITSIDDKKREINVNVYYD